MKSLSTKHVITLYFFRSKEQTSWAIPMKVTFVA